MYWDKPCADNKVWTDIYPIDINQERIRRGLPASDWQAVFLEPNPSVSIDALYFLKNSIIPKTINYSAKDPSLADPKDPSRLDSGKIVLIQKWEGLNDCSHFVSECLKAGGAGEVYNVGVPGLVAALRKRGDVKTLGYFLDAATAELVINADVMKPGDVIAYGDEKKGFSHAHSVIYMGKDAAGDYRVANHSRFNHPSFRGDWKLYTHPLSGHPRVILLHFGFDDADPLPGFAVLGWWEVVWRGQSFYYYFEKTGRVGWTQQKPKSLKQPLPIPQGSGYHFHRLASKMQVVWSQTGSVEEFETLKVAAGTMTGMWNGSEPMTAKRM